MTEHPILFNGEMVRAIIEGRKTQTRRAIELPRWAEPMNEDYEFEIDGPIGKPRSQLPYAISRKTGCMAVIDCPYGQAGDYLWVRETIRYSLEHNNFYFDADDKGGGNQVYRGLKKKTCPSIHMPRWASRITLEVVSVRVERVQEISEADAEAEGAFDSTGSHDFDCQYMQPYPSDEYCPGGCGKYSSEETFGRLWDTINAKRGYGWSVNPWCWVVEFKGV